MTLSTRDSDVGTRMARLMEAVDRARELEPSLRRGQAYFNALYFGEHDPEFADEIRGGSLDPFYDDGKIEVMLEALRERWGGHSIGSDA